MSTEINSLRKWQYLSLFVFFAGLLIAFFDYMYSGKYFVVIAIMSFAALAASIGMFWRERFWSKYKRFSKYLSAFLISAATFSLYLSTANIFYAVLSLSLIMMVIAEDLKLFQHKT